MKISPLAYPLHFFNVLFCLAGAIVLFSGFDAASQSMSLGSKPESTKITLSLTKTGELRYNVTRRGKMIIADSPLGLDCNDQNFTAGLSVVHVSPVDVRRENYELKTGHFKTINHVFETKSITVKNKLGARMIIDLLTGNEGVAFRYRFPDQTSTMRVINAERTGFQIEKKAKGWLQPYNKAGKVTPGYEDFYFSVHPGDSISNPRNPSVGWCMPALFQVNEGKSWILLAESGTDGSFPGCHLQADSKGGLYKIAFAEKDEKYTLPLGADNHPTSTLPWAMPWRVIIVGDQAGDILLSSMITDLAPASKLEDTSWIEPGKATWSWWSHPEDHSPEMYNQFTDLAASFGFRYTLFDAGWEKANTEGGIIAKATARGIKPMVWGYSAAYFDAEKRKKRFKELAAMGVKGVKIDFWCSDRQEVMACFDSLFNDAAKEHLLINLHGTTVPRGWHRTWPNFMTAEAVLGAEHYFYEPRYPDLAAQQNTVLPFTRNVAGPTDYTPFALTIRKYPRLNTAVHELATAMIYTSGIIHFADSKEVFDSLPVPVRQLLKDMPASWDNTESIVAEPGEQLILARQKEGLSYLVGINGTNKAVPVKLNLSKYTKGFSKFKVIVEGEDPLMDFKTETYPITSIWQHTFAPKGGFIIQFVNE
ncbi:glycoside hydrolase family 97 protein [Spirosoma sp. RP8]|uniref:Glycoside hydrolase family 97 protein n=1 Tax=Spirosoma liriopis TaxID=2937440 RepID=A0ABT0HV06_9BACT|nr:glycoside hydrolase family 97 protein [Spirosoma liriopis]MCK8495988.1 glycoside hydrolase family 97 protein [Spirosoma liriopis]